MTGLLDINPWGIFKWFVVIGLVMYSVFALLIVKQVGIMTETVETEANGLVKAFAWAHLFMALGIIVVTILFL
jgi:hypothetical protein